MGYRSLFISVLSLCLAPFALAEDCTIPERPVFSLAGEELDTQGYNDLTAQLIAYEADGQDYRDCLDVLISAREDGWVEALDAFNASSRLQAEVYQEYAEISDQFMLASEERATAAKTAGE